MYLDTEAIIRLRKKRSKLKLIVDRIFFPFVALVSTSNARKFGLTPIDEERLITVYNHLKGKILDIGCGENTLVKAYVNGIGVDTHPWEGVDILLEDTAKLPFKDLEFDTITIIAALNHIPNRSEVLRESNRVLKSDGRLLITMITPMISKITHRIRYRFDPDQSERGMKDGEVYGFTKNEMINLLNANGFILDKIVPFVFGLNRLYKFKKAINEHN